MLIVTVLYLHAHSKLELRLERAEVLLKVGPNLSTGAVLIVFLPPTHFGEAGVEACAELIPNEL